MAWIFYGEREAVNVDYVEHASQSDSQCPLILRMVSGPDVSIPADVCGKVWDAIRADSSSAKGFSTRPLSR